MKNERERHIGFQIKTVSNLIRRHVDNSAAHAYMESLTGTNMWVIIYLVHHRNEDVFQRDLEQNFSVRRSTMSNILALMEKKGLILRESVPQDARLKKLVLTEKSLDLYEMMEEDRRQTDELITSGFSAEELETLSSLLGRMRENLEKIDGPCEMPHKCRRKPR